MGAYPAYKKDYDAMVFIDGTDVVAISNDGSVIDHGTAGTDDATVIQAAIDSLTVGGTLYLQSGTYIIGSTINASYDGLTIVGSGESTILKGTVALAAAILKIQAKDKCIVKNIQFDGDYPTTTGGILLQIRNSDTTKVIDCSFKNCDIAIDVIQYTTEITINVVIERCYFNNCGNGTSKTAIYTRMIGTIPLQNISISQCIFDAATTSQAYNAGDILLKDTNNFVINNNLFINGLNHGIMLRLGCENGIISGNSFLNCTVGSATDGMIHVSGAKYISIIENTLKWTSNPALSTTPILLGTGASNYYISINGNSIDGGGFANVISAIYSHGDANPPDFTANYGISICGNNIYGTSHGITLTATSDACVIGNSISTLGTGLFIAGSRYCEIIGNTIISALIGLSTSSGNSANNIIIGNNLRGGTTPSTIGTGINTVCGNVGYVDISEIRDSLNNVLEVLGDVRLLLPQVEITGTSITDYTRRTNTCTASTSVATWYGFQGRATYYDYNGTSYYLYRADDADFTFGDGSTDEAFSIVACVNPDGVTSRTIMAKWDATTAAEAREWKFGFDASGYPTMILYDESANAYIGRQDQTAFATGTWKVLVATYDGGGSASGVKIYIDGVQLDDADVTDGTYVAMEDTATQLTIGSFEGTAGAQSEFYDGKMTWVGIAAKELDADEVWSLTQRLKGVLGV